MHTYKKFWGLALLTAFVAVLEWHTGGVLGIPAAHAEDLTGSIITYGSIVVGMLITGLNVLMWVLFWLLGLVTNPDLIFTDGIVSTLFMLWQLFRNIVNVAFAVLLIIGAILTIITANTDRVKGVLPKFVMAVILVNFSWFIPRVIYDVSQVVAYSVYQLPTWVDASDCVVIEVAPGGGVVGKKCKVVNDIKFFENTDKVTDKQDDWDCTLKPLVCVQLKDYDDNTVLNRRSQETVIFNGLIVNFARLKNLAAVVDGGRIAGGQPTPISALLLWFVKIIVVLVIHIALFFPLLALIAAFFIRIPVLWLTMAFMPFVVLGFVVDQIKSETDQISDAFIKAAFLPAIVGIPFAIGFILINVSSKIAMPDIPGVNVKIPLFDGLDNFWQIFWLAMSLGILWKGVFMALERGPAVVNHFTAGIKSVGEAAGSVALKAPLSVPLPLPTGTASLLSLKRKLDPRQIEARMESGDFWNDTQKKASAENANKMTKEVANTFKNDIKVVINNPNDPNSAKVIADAIAKGKRSTPDIASLNNEEWLRAYIAKLDQMGEHMDDLTQKKLFEALKRAPPSAPAAPAAPGAPAHP